MAKLIPEREDLLSAGFVAVDFETANRLGGISACQIALVKVQDRQIVERYSTLIKPPEGWDRFEFTYLHGIGPSDVVHAPMWTDIAALVSDFVGDMPVWAHNSSFDSKVWRDLDAHFGTCTAPDPVYCSYRTARRLIPGLADYRLPTVVGACAPHFHLTHHTADSDAEACALIVAALQERT
ncbi:exonuclease domain-containing protein [Actinomyces mediterranea]|uniref:exonuclease domain-containing protein n=1 Tax=Actinomyces mediterranea TaxID=1871028 RepID=UPI0009711466|nr:exonuclease domain-containing protein [Actinomyces mediterranea]